jgi:hypothetical protein
VATILLSAAGAALGGTMGGTVLGLSSVAAGRFIGATLGRAIDQRVMGRGSDVVETGRIDRLRLTGSGEGQPVSRVYGRMRIGGHVIWATRFLETVTTSGGGGGGKGSPSRPQTREYSYSISLAVALCEGVIAGIGRVWADGAEISASTLNLRVYPGTADQMPDPLIEAVEGSGTVPAYRGLAYVVIENFDLGPFGNRVPQFSFEVIRPDQSGLQDTPDPAQLIQGVALIPGTGEFSLSTTPAVFPTGPGSARVANVNTASGQTDFVTSLGQLTTELPQCGAVSLVVSWFGNDLRCGTCRIQPKVEQKLQEASGTPWSVAGLTRGTALEVPSADGRIVYGGTPSDHSVIEAIRALKAEGKEVMFYPFILMDQTAANTLPDPRSGASSQPVLPWRGRITASVAPGREGTPDGTNAISTELVAFFGTAQAAHFTVSGARVIYSGPAEWSYRRFILHQAAICKAAGGVESFCIGSEMVALLQLRDASGFPAVAALQALAAEVRALLGPQTKIGYAADWTEYSGYSPASGDRFFHLDPLWADANIDFIGIDNYMPLSDWRDANDAQDAHWGSLYNLDYLRANIEAGEGYDWYYPSPEAVEHQRREPITDGAFDEPWVWRIKDIRNWWSNPHHNRIGGERAIAQTAWVPRSKPIRFTEIGCAAIDKGTNQPNRFVDPKSSESGLPRASTGARDELVQMQYLRALLSYWGTESRNPASDVYNGAMLDLAHTYVWAWDARPYPAFPRNRDVWSDGENHARGHCLTGRMSARSLSSVVAEICKSAGLTAFDVSELHGVVRGFALEDTSDARAALQPLMLRYGFDAVERDGKICFLPRSGVASHEISLETVVETPEIDGRVEFARASEAEQAGRVRLRFVEAEADFEVGAEESVLPDESTHSVSASELALAMTRAEARQLTERWLGEARVARDTLRFALPPSRAVIGAGDVVRLSEGEHKGDYRIETLEIGPYALAEAVRVEAELYRPLDIPDETPSKSSFVAPIPPLPLFLDLPLITGTEEPHAPHLAITASPWPGSVALYAASTQEDYELLGLFGRPATVGTLLSPLKAASPALVDNGTPVHVRLSRGTLQSVSLERLFAGANLAAIGDGSPENWELIQFAEAQLIAPSEYLISARVRGRNGTDAAMPAEWPVGSYFVLFDQAVTQVPLAASTRGLSQTYRIGPARRAFDDPSFVEESHAFRGLGLRPLSPVHLKAAPDAEGLRLSWIRRTRQDGDTWEGLDVPLAEETELYRIRILSGSTILREAFSPIPEWSYPASEVEQDRNSPEIKAEITQISARFGPGAPGLLRL